MPITFDTLEELKEFCQSFNLEGGKRLKAAVAKQMQDDEEAPAPKKRGRKPNAEKAMPVAPSKNGRSSRMNAEDLAPKRKGRPAAVTKLEKPKRDKSQTLTAKIQTAIQNYVDKGNSFTANDIYAVLAKKDDSINKQSVITSVLKQMNSVYNNVAVTERPGNGPRPVKLYNAS
jgi:hypothetical protein